jgi:hypothetical protein
VLANLGRLSDAQVALLRRAFAGLAAPDAASLATSVHDLLAGLTVTNLEYLAVAVAYEAWRRSQLGTLLARLLPPTETEVDVPDVLAALACHRCVAPGSKLAATRWFPHTALPELMGLPAARFNNTRVHRSLAALDGVTPQLQEHLPDLYRTDARGFTAVFLDVTNTWFVGRGPLVAEKAFTKEGRYEYAIGIVLLCTAAGLPLRWEVVSARNHDSLVMTKLLGQVAGLEWMREVPVVVDRAMGRTANLRDLTATGLRFITALTTLEFDAYAAGALPGAALAHLTASTPDLALKAAAAVSAAGLQQVSDTLYLRDLGVVERVPSDGAAAPVVLDATNSARHALALAAAAQTLVAAGTVRDYSAAARQLHLPTQTLSEYRRLLDLIPQLQDEARAGRAVLPLKALRRIARLPAAAQWDAYTQHNRAPVTRRQPHRASQERPPVAPLRLRVVVCFSPRLFVEHRQNAAAALDQVRALEHQLNEQLRSGRSRRGQASVLAEVHTFLRQRDLLEAFAVRVEQRDDHAVSVALVLDDQNWTDRRRFDGISVIVAHPDVPQAAAEIVRLYRAKDCVEKDFQHIKSEIELRPVWHHTDAKVRAHVSLCMLALLLDRTLERTLREQGYPCTAKALYEQLQTVHLNRMQLRGTEESYYKVSTPTPDQLTLLQHLGMTPLVDEPALVARITPR